MKITVNGSPRDVPDRCTLEQLVEREGLAAAPCAAELNRLLVPKAQRADTTLREGDRVELVTLVGGG